MQNQRDLHILLANQEKKENFKDQPCNLIGFVVWFSDEPLDFSKSAVAEPN